MQTLKDIMETNGLLQKRIAQMTGIPESTFSRIVNGDWPDDMQQFLITGALNKLLASGPYRPQDVWPPDANSEAQNAPARLSETKG